MQTRMVFVTCLNLEEGKRIAKEIIKAELAACVNIIEGVTSVYKWEGVIEEESEVLLIIKSNDSLLKRLEEKVLSVHPYDTPEFIALKPEFVTEKYQQWLDKSVSHS